MKIITDFHHLMHSIRTISFSSYRIKEDPTGVSIFLVHSLEETIFELTQPIDAKTKAKIVLALADYKHSSSHNTLSLPAA